MKRFGYVMAVFFFLLSPLTGEEYQFLGSHFLASYYECDEGILDDQEALNEALVQAIEASGATLLKVVGHKFNPAGVTLVALLSESHASVHTYPEFKACFVDFFTCGDRCDYIKFDTLFKKRLKAHRATSEHIVRR